MDETSWNTTITFPYYRSKTESERLAWRLSEERSLSMVSVLPTAMVGPYCFGHLTPTMDLINRIAIDAVPFDVNFFFNYVDVRDVAEGMVRAAERGCPGERYILGSERTMGTTEVIELARSLFPGNKKPLKLPKTLLKMAALLTEFGGKITRRKPLLLRTQVALYYGVRELVDISKAKRELGYDPRPAEEAVREALLYLRGRDERSEICE